MHLVPIVRRFVAALVIALPRVANAAPGDLDAGFGTGGIFVSPFETPDTFRRERWVAVDHLERPLIAATTIGDAGTEFQIAVARLTTGGVPDVTFNPNGPTPGVLVFGFGAPGCPDGTTSGPIAKGVVATPDHHIVVAANLCAGTTQRRIGLARLDEAGAFDAGFDGDGKLVTTVNGTNGYVPVVESIAVDASERVYVAGSRLTDCNFATGVCNGRNALLARYTSTGALDATYNAAGSLPGVLEVATANVHLGFLTLRLLADERVLAAGDTLVVRVAANGTLETSFGPLGTPPGTIHTGLSIYGVTTTDADASVLVTGQGFDGGTSKLVLAKLTSTGAADASFAVGGPAPGVTTTSNGVLGVDVQVQANGAIVVAGFGFVGNGPNRIVVARYGADGQLDPSFGPASPLPGTVATEVGNLSLAEDGALQSDGKILVVGSRRVPPAEFAVVVLRYLGGAAGDPTPTVVPTPGPGRRSILRIADTTTAIPGGTGTFTALRPPTLACAPVDPCRLIFVGEGSGGQQGIYASELDDVVTPLPPPIRVADLTTAIPDGAGGFTALDGPSIACAPTDPCRLLFVGAGGGGQQGIYASELTEVGVPSPPPIRVADLATTIPGGTGSFTALGSPSLACIPVDPCRLTFVGSGSGGQQGIYASELADVGVPTPPPIRVADLATTIPGGTGTFTALDGPSLACSPVDPCRLTFVGAGSGGQAGVYASVLEEIANPQPPPIRVADLATTIPGGTGDFTAVDGPSLACIPTDPCRLAFVGAGSGGQAGVYANPLGEVGSPNPPPIRIADVTTEIPRGTGTFTTFDTVAAAGRHTAFVGNGGSGQRGLFVASRPDAIVAVGDAIDGKTVTDVALARGGFAGAALAFTLGFDDGSAGVFAAFVEECGNCRDDDGDGLVDRADADCPAPAVGGAFGLDADAGRAKALVGCASAVQKAGAAFAAKRRARLTACLDAAFPCAADPADAGCPAKAAAKCTKTLAADALTKDRAKLDAALTKACGAVAPADLRAVLGLGFAAADGPCAEVEAVPPTSVATLAACVAAEHACRAEELASFAAPRAATLLADAGIAPLDFPCLLRGTGAAAALDPSVRKPARKCQQALAKAGAKLADGAVKAGAACARSVLVCLQQKSADPKCLPKAQASCGKGQAKVEGPKGLGTKLAAAVAKACAASALPFATVLAADGLDLGARAGACTALTGGTLDSAAALASCVGAHHACRAAQLLESELPRLRELTTLGGAPLP